MALFSQEEDMEEFWNIVTQLLEGTGVTLQLFFVTVLLSIPLGMLVCLMRMSKIPPLRCIAQLYILLFRGTPLMLHLVFFFFGRPMLTGGVALSRESAAAAAFALNYAAYFAEIFRGGLQSIPTGQYEAARVLNLSRMQCFFRIIVPQLIKRVLPPVGNEVVTLVKDTALVYAVAISDLLRVAKTIMMNQADFRAFIVAGLFYLVMTSLVTFVFHKAEKKLSYYTI